MSLTSPTPEEFKAKRNASHLSRKGNLTKERLIGVANEGGNFIYDPAYNCFEDLDGSHAKTYLESKGFEGVTNYDTGHNGLAKTKCGICLSTNGYLYRAKEIEITVKKRSVQNGRN